MSTKPDASNYHLENFSDNFCSPFFGSLNPRPSKLRGKKKSATAFTHFIKGTTEGKSVAFGASEKKSKGLRTH